MQLLVLGAGPGIGAALARRFAREGYAVALAARSPDRLADLAAEVGGTAHQVDLTDPVALARTVIEVGEQGRGIDVLAFNPSVFRMADPMHLGCEDLLEDLRLGVAPLLTAVQAARPFFHDGARVLVTGSAAADTPSNRAASLGVQKAALRNLVNSLDTTLAPDGIRAVAVQVNGVLADEGTFAPDQVADAMYAATCRPDEDWTPHVPYPR